MRALALLFALAAGTGCGYRTSLVLNETDELVGVEFFGNDTKRPDLEREFQPFVTDALNRMVQATLVAPDRSGLVVRGRMLYYGRRGGIRSVNNELLEVILRVSVEAQLVRRTRTADGSWQEEQLGAGSYGSDNGFLVQEPGGEERALERLLRNIGDRMVLDLFGPLAYETAP